MNEIITQYLAELIAFLVISVLLYIVNYICNLIIAYRYFMKKREENEEKPDRNIKKSGFQNMLDQQYKEAQEKRNN
jgi:hypothetical protein